MFVEIDILANFLLAISWILRGWRWVGFCVGGRGGGMEGNADGDRVMMLRSSPFMCDDQTSSA